MAMKPQLVALLEAMKALGLKPMHELSPVDAREQMEAGVRARNIPPIELGSVEERSIPGPHGEIPVRVYRPEGADAALGALVYYHGGGHVMAEQAADHMPAAMVIDKQSRRRGPILSRDIETRGDQSRRPRNAQLAGVLDLGRRQVTRGDRAFHLLARVDRA